MPPVTNVIVKEQLAITFRRVLLKCGLVTPFRFRLSPIGDVIARPGEDVERLNVTALVTDIFVPKMSTLQGVNAGHKRRVNTSPDTHHQREVVTFPNQIGVRLGVQLFYQLGVKLRAMFGGPGIPCRHYAGMFGLRGCQVVVRRPEPHNVIPIEKIRLLGRVRVGRNDQAQEK